MHPATRNPSRAWIFLVPPTLWVSPSVSSMAHFLVPMSNPFISSCQQPAGHDDFCCQLVSRHLTTIDQYKCMCLGIHAKALGFTFHDYMMVIRCYEASLSYYVIIDAGQDISHSSQSPSPDKTAVESLCDIKGVSCNSTIFSAATFLSFRSSAITAIIRLPLPAKGPQCRRRMSFP